jgi:hypothetical protein
LALANESHRETGPDRQTVTGYGTGAPFVVWNTGESTAVSAAAGTGRPAIAAIRTRMESEERSARRWDEGLAIG